MKSFDHFVVNRVKVVGNEATAILRMSKIVNSLFTHNHFAHNTGLAIRAFQLFSAAAVNTSRKLVNFRTLTWQSSQGESKEDSTGPPTF